MLTKRSLFGMFLALLATWAGAPLGALPGPLPGAGEQAGDAAATSYFVYVCAESSDEVYLVEFDGTEAKVAKRIPVGYQPTEVEGPHGLTVSPDGSHWYLTMAHGKPYGILYKYATGTDELVGQVELGLFPATMQISSATGLLYCVNFDLHGDMSPSSVSIVDPDEMVEVARTTTGPMPHGSRISPDGMKHYSCAMMSGQLFELDAVSFDIERTLDLTAAPAAGHEGGMGEGHGEDAHGGKQGGEQGHGAGGHDQKGHGGHGAKAPKPTWVFPHPTESRVYVCLNGLAEIVEVDLEHWKITRRFPTDKGPYNVEITADGSKMVATYKSAQSIGIWDLASGEELVRLPSSRKVTHGVVLSPDSRYAFVSSEGIGSEKGTLDVYDLHELKLVSTVELGLQAGGIAFWKAEKH